MRLSRRQGPREPTPGIRLAAAFGGLVFFLFLVDRFLELFH